MFPATANTLTTIIAAQTEIEPGTVERRLVSYFFEGLKYDLYDLISIRLGRDSREAETCKGKVLAIMRSVKKVCYELINDELNGRKQLDGQALVGIVRYIVPSNDPTGGPLWRQLEPLFRFTFKSDKHALKFIREQIDEYVLQRAPLIERDFDKQWAGAVEYIKRYRES